MAELVKVNKKVIFDPLYTPVRKFLAARIAMLEQEGPPEELALAKERYTGLMTGDIVIEDAVDFPDGKTRVCIVSRKTGFARADLEIERVTVKEILGDFGVPFVVISDTDNLKTFSKTNEEPAVLLWLEYKNTYGVLLTQESAKTIEGPMAAFGDLFFNQYTTEREGLDYIDYDTIESGTVTIKDAAFGQATYPLFIQELVLNEANLPIITSNLPESITTQRGQTFNIPNTYWFGGTLDITATAIVEITTGSGYTIPVRAGDLLSIDGETIYGDATKEVEDVIIVRVTHQYQGRPVRRTFRIKVLIEKDTQFDLTFTVSPERLKAAKGDDVEIVVHAFFKGDPITIQVPAAEFVSAKHYGNLSYVETRTDGGMVYQGKITGTPPLGAETDSELYIAEYNYSEGGTVHTAPAYLNMDLVRAEARPTLEIRGLTSTLRGYINDTGKMLVSAFFGGEPISTKLLSIRTGPRGDESSSIRFDEVVDDGVNFTIIRDSQKPGEDLEDAFDQAFRYIDENGVKHIVTRNIKIIVSKLSVIEIIPVPPTPRVVTRYQKGGPTWRFMINGENRTHEAIGLAMTGGGEWMSMEGGLWSVDKVADEDLPLTVKFTWTQVYDGKNHQHEFEQEFLIKKWNPNENPGDGGTGEGGEGEGGDGGQTGGGGEGEGNDGGGPGDNSDEGVNTEVVVFPMYYGLGGLSDERGKIKFRVYDGPNDITATAVHVESRMVLPPELVSEGFAYNSSEGVLEWSYYKRDPITKGEAKFFFKAPKDAGSPPNKRLGRMFVTANVKQSRILKVVEITPKEILLDHTAEPTVRLSFAGEEISLLDPALTITRTWKAGQPLQTAVLMDTLPSSMVFKDTTLRGPNTVQNSTAYFEAKMIDPDTQEEKKLEFAVPLTTRIPPLVREYTHEGPIDTRIWESADFPVKYTIGERDITAMMGSSEQGLPYNKYISNSGRGWTCYNAEKEAITTKLGITFRYYINADYPINFAYADFTYNIEAWDGVTFGVDYDPEEIIGDSGDTGEIVANFVYKRNDVTKGIRFNRAGSTIPNNIVIQDPIYVEGKGTVIRYTLQRGYKFPMKLVFQHPTLSDTIPLDLDVDVKWAAGLNLETSGNKISGFHADPFSFPLVFNFSGTRLDTNSPDLAITYTSTPADATSLTSVTANGLVIGLDKGGIKGNSYDYQSKIAVVYTDPATGTKYPFNLDIPVTIRVPDVRLGANPSITAKVYARGEYKVTLVDERGKNVPITIFTPNGTNNYVNFVAPKSWYVTKGDRTQTILTEQAMTLSYEIGGNSYTMDVEIPFTVLQFDGIDFTAETTTKKLEGTAGTQGEMEFKFTYLGDLTEEVILDTTRSVIPRNLAIGKLTGSKLAYTFIGQGTDNVKLVFVRKGAPATPVIGVDMAEIVLPVISKSSNEPFVLVSNDDQIALQWGKTGVLNIKVKYGEYELPGNAPGLRYVIREDGDKATTVAGGAETGVTLRADKGSKPGESRNYLDVIDIFYDVGAPTAKQVTVSFNSTISTPQPTLKNNEVVAVAVWDKGSFPQALEFDEVPQTQRLKMELTRVDEKYLEMQSAFGYEVIGAESTTQTFQIPLRLTYRIKGVDEDLTYDFNAPVNIRAHTYPRFNVEVTPAVIQTTIDGQQVVNCRPVYKDLPVGAAATFKEELCKFPKQVRLVNHEIVDFNHKLTFEGLEAGVGEVSLVFWSPEAGAVPEDRDVWNGKVRAEVMGEPGIEIGNRDNLIVGHHESTGTYKMEVLFGGIPVDLAAEIAKGVVTFNAIVPGTAEPYAGVLAVTKVGVDTFEYKLTGPVQPDATVEVTDRLRITYKWGGTTYDTTVEIPLEYTTGPVVIGGTTIYNNVKMWAKANLGGITALCDGKDLASTWALTSQAGVQSKYIKYTLKSYEVINADITDRAEVVPTTFSGTYRGRPWSGVMDLTFNILAWNQLTYEVFYANVGDDKWNGLTDDKRNVYVGAKYKGVTVIPGDMLDDVNTDFKGLVDITYKGTNNVGGSWTWYEATALKEGAEVIRMKMVRQSGDAQQVPPVENVDFAYLDFNVTIKNAPLTLGGTIPLSGGNGDIIGSGTRTVKLKTLNIQLNDPNLTITLENEDIFKIVAVTPTSMNFEITAPLDKPKQQYSTKMTFRYTDPGTGRVHVGEVNQLITIRDPLDYPVVARRAGFNPSITLWQKGNSPCTVTASGTDILSQVTELRTDPDRSPVSVPEYWTPTGIWWQCTNALLGSWMPNSTFYFKAPFRGGEVELSHRVDWTVGSAPQPIRHIWGSVTPVPIQVKKDVAGEMRFALLYRNDPYTKATINTTLTDLKGAIRIDSTEVSGNVMLVKFTGLQDLTAAVTIPVVWDMADQDDYVEGTNRVTINVTAVPGLRIEPVPLSVKIWSRVLVPFKVWSGTTDITYQCAMRTVNNQRLKLEAVSATPPWRFQVIDCPTVEETVPVVYGITLPASYASVQMDVTADLTFQAWDGREFKATLPVLPVDAETQLPVWSVPLGDRAGFQMTSVLTNAANPNGVNASLGSLVDQGAINTSGLFKWYSGGSGTSGFNAIADALTVGKTPGKMVATYYQGNGVSQPNGYPSGTEGKNKHTFDIIYEVFEAKLSWKDGKIPDRVPMSYLGTGQVVGELMFGREAVPLNTCAINIKASDQAKAYTWGTTANWGGGYFYLEGRYDNPHGDLDTEVEITINWTKNSKMYSITYLQPVTLRGNNSKPEPVWTTGEVKTISDKVWGSNGAVPFTLYKDGVAFPWNTVKTPSITVVENDYVQAGPTVSTGYYIIKGDPVNETRVDVEYIATATDGVRLWTIHQVVPFIIAPYDGIELKFDLMTKSPFNNGIAHDIRYDTTYNFSGYFRGRPIATGAYTIKSVTHGTGFTVFSQTSGPGALMASCRSATDIPDNVNSRWLITKVGVTPGQGGSKEGIDYVYLDIPLIMYIFNKLYVVEVTDEMVGKFGDKIEMVGKFRTGITPQPLGSTYRLSFTPNTILTYNWSTDLQAEKFYLGFVKEIAVPEVQTKVKVDAGLDGAPMNRWCSFDIDVTQQSPVEHPVIQDVQEVTTRVFEKGPLPFKVMHKGVDVSANITGLTIDGNYVGVISETPNVWQVIKADATETIVLPRFNFKLTVEGVTFDLSQEVKFTIGAFNGTKLTVNAAKDINVGINTAGVLKFTGTWGSQPIGDTVTFDDVASDMKGLLSLQAATPDGSGGININYTGILVGRADVEFIFRAKIQNPVAVEGYDWVKVTVPTDVLGTTLTKGDVFDVAGTGDQFVVTVLNQSVKYNGIVLDNTDPDLTITMSGGSKVAIVGKTANTVTYRYLTPVTVDTIQRPTVIFEYKGVARIEVPLALTQKALTTDLEITDVEDIEVEIKKAYSLPFKVIGSDGKDLSNVTTITSLSIDGDESYFRTDGTNAYSVINADTESKVGTAYFEISVLDNGVAKSMVVTVQMTIKAWASDILDVTLITPESGVVTGLAGGTSIIVANITRLGQRLTSDDVRILPSSLGAGVTSTTKRTLANGNIQFTLAFVGIVAWNNNAVFEYIPDAAKPQIEGVTRRTKVIPTWTNTANTLRIVVSGYQDNNLEGSTGDIQLVYLRPLYGETLLANNHPDVSWMYSNTTGQTGASKVAIQGTGADHIRVRLVNGPAWANMTATCTYKGGSTPVSVTQMCSVRIWKPTASTAIGKILDPLQGGNEITPVFEVPTPVYDWKDYGASYDGPIWKFVNAKWKTGLVRVFDTQTNTVVGPGVQLADLRPDSLGRYRVNIPTSHTQQELRIDGTLMADRDGKERYEVLVNEFRMPIAPAPVTVTANPSNPDATLDVVTQIEYRTRQPRGSDVYTFLEAPNWTTAQGIAIADQGGPVSGKPGYFTVNVKGLGVNHPDAYIQGVVRDEDGRTYTARMNLNAKIPEYIVFNLTEKEITGKEKDVVTLNGSATYKGNPLAFDSPGVSITFDPPGILDLKMRTATTIVANVIKEVPADDSYDIKVQLTAHEETQEQDLKVNIEDVPDLVITEAAVITGGNNDTGSSTFKVSYRGTNIPLNDPKLTITPKAGFTITAKRANGFDYKITESLTDVGKTMQRDVDLVYTVNANVTSKGKYVQSIQVTQPADYPKGNNPRATATLWAVGPTGNIGLVITSGATNVTSQCEMLSWGPGWATMPDAPNTQKYWYYIVSGPATAGEMTQTGKVRAPFRGNFVEIDIQVTWVSYGVGPNFSQISGTVTPTILEVENGKQKQAVFSMKYRNKVTTNVVLNIAESGFIKDGKPVITIDKVEAVGDTMVVTYTGAVGAIKTKLDFCWDLKDIATPVQGETRGLVSVDTFTGMVITKNQNEKVSIWQVKQIPFTVTIDGVDITSKLTMASVVEPWIADWSAGAAGPRYQVIDSATVETTKDVTFKVKLPAANGGEIIDVVVPVTFAAWDGNVFTTAQYGSGDSNVLVNKAVSASFGMTFKGSSVYYNTDWEVDRNTVPDLNAGFLAYNSEGLSTPSNWPWAAVHGTKPGHVDHGRIGIHYKGAGSTAWPRGTLGKNYSILTIGAITVYDLGIYWKSGVQPGPVAGAKGDTITIPADLTYRGGTPMAASSLTSITVLTPGVISAPTSTAAKSWNANVIFDNRGEDADMPVSIRYTYTYSGETYTMTYDQVITVKGTGTGDDVKVIGLSEISSRMYDSGRLPFGVSVNGVNIPENGFKSIAVADNEYLTAGPTHPNAWTVKGASRTNPVKSTVKFTVVINNGAHDFTVEQDVVVNIAQWDGSDFWIKAVAGLNYGNRAATFLMAAQYDLTVCGYNKTTPVTTLAGSKSHPNLNMPNTNPIEQRPNWVYQFRTLNNWTGRTNVTVRLNYGIGPYTEGVNTASITVPVICYNSGQYFALFIDPLTMEGKLGEEQMLDVDICSNGSRLPLNPAVHLVTALPAGIIDMVPGSMTSTGFKMKFVGDVLKDTTTDISVLVSHSNNSALLKTGWTEKVIQHPLLDVPGLEITEVKEISSGSGDTGRGSFKVAYRGTNIPLNDPKLTWSIATSLEVTDVTATDFEFKNNEPFSTKGKVSCPVTLSYQVSEDDVSTGAFTQVLNMVNPKDFPVVGNIQLVDNLNPLAYSLIGPFRPVTSGGVDISEQCTLKSITRPSGQNWVTLPETPVAGKWAWCYDTYRASPATVYVDFVVLAPFRGETVEIPVSGHRLYWGTNPPAVKNRFDISHTPDTVPTRAGLTGEIEFDVKFAGAQTTNVNVGYPSIPGITFSPMVVRDGKIIVPYSCDRDVGSAPGFLFTKTGVGSPESLAHTVRFSPPPALIMADGFQTEARGNKDNPVTLTQSVLKPN